MSSVDPLAALAAQLAVTQAGSDVALDLGAIAQILQAQLQLGDILEATVLPPQGGQDLIAILGQTVVAQLPQGVHPGDTLLLQVTGFQGNQIVVRNLGIADPNNPVPVFIPDLPQASGSAPAAVLTTIVPQPNVPPGAPALAQQTQPVIIPPPANGPPVAPPTAVFVAASIQQPAAQAPTAAATPAAPPLPPPPPVDIESRLAASRAATAEPVLKNAGLPSAPQAAGPQAAASPSAAPQSPPGAQSVPSAPVDVEARLAATRAASADKVLQTPQQEARIASANPRSAQQLPAAAARTEPRTVTPSAHTLRQSIATRAVGIPTTPPLISRAAPQTPAQAPTQIPAQVTAAPTPSKQPPAPAPATQSVSAQLSVALASKDPVRILAALHIPASTVTLAATKVISTASTQVQTALQHLERVLAQAPPTDARVDTLQTLTSFLARLDPRNTQTLTAQISSFVSNVIDGAEHKLSALLQALLPRQIAAALPPPNVNLPAHVNTPAPAHVPILAQAHAAERQIALTQDLKATLLSLVANPAPGTSAQLTQALNQTLTALTAMQFNTLIAAQQDPSTIALSIPMMFFDGGQPANVRISRDAPKNKSQRMDADNFRIAFVLDTQTLGTVAIDLETVGRQVKVNVKTDRASAVDQFNTSLGDLRTRLEHLRYKVTSSGAGMATSGAAAPQVVDTTPIPESDTNVDLKA